MFKEDSAITSQNLKQTKIRLKTYIPTDQTRNHMLGNFRRLTEEMHEENVKYRKFVETSKALPQKYF